jgi:glutathione synthase/RimK-type ligase-like ATP-grasp enzyme
MKDKITLVGIHGRPSMKKVYDQMDVGDLIVRRKINLKKGGRKVYYRHYTNNDVTKLNKDLSAPDLSNAIVIRWGTREEVPTSNGTIVYNKSSAIANATNKSRSRSIMIDAGVSCPKLVTPENFHNDDLPIIARPPVHAKGRNFVVLRNRSQFENHYRNNVRHEWYYSAFIDKENEYRVHTAHGKVLALMEKQKPTDGKIAWNRARNLDDDGFEYVAYGRYGEKPITNALIQAINATNSLGLDFAGVDVMTRGNDAFVLEANTSPTLNSSDYVSERYAEYFQWLLSSEKRRPHFERTDYKKPKNFWFYHEQLK